MCVASAASRKLIAAPAVANVESPVVPRLLAKPTIAPRTGQLRYTLLSLVMLLAVWTQPASLRPQRGATNWRVAC